MGNPARSMGRGCNGFNDKRERRLDDRRCTESSLPAISKDRSRRGRQFMTQMTGGYCRGCPGSAVVMTTAVRFSPLVLRRACEVADQRADRRSSQRRGQQQSNQTHLNILSQGERPCPERGHGHMVPLGVTSRSRTWRRSGSCCTGSWVRIHSEWRSSTLESPSNPADLMSAFNPITQPLLNHYSRNRHLYWQGLPPEGGS